MGAFYRCLGDARTGPLALSLLEDSTGGAEGGSGVLLLGAGLGRLGAPPRRADPGVGLGCLWHPP